MSDIQKQKRWFESLDRELNKYFNEDEASEIIGYYEEMFNDKLDEGQDIDDVLDQYDPKQIAKSMIPKVLSGRKVTNRTTANNLWLMLLILFSTPILLPLGIVYITLMIVVLSLIFTGVVMVISGVAGIAGSLINAFLLGLAAPDLMITVGVQLLALAVVIIVGYVMAKLSWKALQYLALWFSKLLTRKKD